MVAILKGVTHRGLAHEPANMKIKDLGNLRIRFAPGNLPERHVVIAGSKDGPSENDFHITLKKGINASYQADNGDLIEAKGQNLFVNGVKVDVTGRKIPNEAQAVDDARAGTQNQRLAALQARFPGVTFDNPEYAKLAKIGPNVKIEPGARIELSPKLQIRGNAKIGAQARVGGNTSIYGGRIDGTVTGGKLEATKVENGAHVRGGEIKKSTIGKGSAVSGGELNHCLVRESRVRGGSLTDTKVLNKSEVKDGVLENMTIKNGATIKKGHLQGFTVDDRDVNGGVHSGGFNRHHDNTAGRQKKTNIFTRIRDKITGRKADKRMFNPDYEGMNRAYDFSRTTYQGTNPYGGYEMPNSLFGNNNAYNPGIVANPWMGYGTAAMAGLGTGALFGLGMGAFGMGMYGLGFGGLGMLSMMGWGMGGLGLGGFNWFAW